MKKRIAVIDYKKCKPDLCGRACIKVCPVNRQDKECITEEENKIIRISEELCTGCGICPRICPYGAISIINLQLDLSEPIHQFGENRFRLYRLPKINENKTVGFIGKNGIGKSTIINVLSGQIIPNLGNLKESFSNYQNIINYFKGKDIQKLFIELENKNYKISYKPQNIELISKIYDGKVIELLNKVNENSLEVNKVITKMNMENIINKNIKNLSGGELQKLAICATYLKKANLYFYDEPSSFLDIKQRFIYSNLIEESNSTNMLVEHDLALLDYLSDELHLIFGEPHVYGIVSNIKTTNIAINEFLEGFIKDENLRFRNYKIDFSYTPNISFDSKNLILDYPDMEKTFDGFKLKIQKGSLYRGNIIGILGENGIGKSTFIKIISGEIKDDENNFSNNMSVSYKSQSLIKYSEINQTVLEFLSDVNQEILKSELWNKLNLERIKFSKLSELNGGDLQKVVISKCLCTNAKIYLIDEPSAFLDVEERLNVAKAIKNIIQKYDKISFVIDHDILFIDFISDKLLVFEGKPGLEGYVHEPYDKKLGMNKFLKLLNVTYRMDPNSKRPRINKLNSSKDKEQKNSNNYYIY